MRIGAYSVLLLVALGGCGSNGGPDPAPQPDAGSPKYSIEKLQDPETCNKCHQKHYQEWSGSMHAYAADDPLFLAMNERGQREANIGNFCVNCHAPLAVAAANGAVVDTAALKALPKSQKGVTCYFCHSIDEVRGTHNNPLHLANDGVMRGQIRDAVANEAHESAYSEFVDRSDLRSSTACGSCHDIVNDHGTNIERTFAEWQGTVYAQPTFGSTCSQCHMDERRNELVAEGPNVRGVFLRNVHGHGFPAVDTAIIDWPESATQKAAVTAQLNIPTLQTALCVTSDSRVALVVDNVAAGHNWPSGASQDRQLWFEVSAFAGGVKIYESGLVPEGTDAMSLADDDLWLLRDCMFDGAGQKTHNFWDAALSDSNTFYGQFTFSRSDPRFYQTHVVRLYPSKSARKLSAYPERVLVRAWLQAFPYEVFDDLLATPAPSGYTSEQLAAMRAKLAPMQVGKDLEWTPAGADDASTGGQIFTTGSNTLPPLPAGIPVSCVTNTRMVANAQSVAAPAHKNVNCKP